MLRSYKPDHYLFVSGMIGFGLLNIIFGRFALQWQPLGGMAFEPLFARLSGVVTILAALGVLVPRVAAKAAIAQGVAFFLMFWLPQLAALRPAALNVGGMLPLAENSAMLAGAVLIACETLSPDGRTGPRPRLAQHAVRVCRAVFGLACLLFGLSHYVYADITAGMIPTFLPGRLALAYLTGTAHILAGLAILSGILGRVAATLEAMMMGLFVLLVHIPIIATAEPAGIRLAWTMLAAALTLCAAASTVAGSFARKTRHSTAGAGPLMASGLQEPYPLRL